MNTSDSYEHFSWCLHALRDNILLCSRAIKEDRAGSVTRGRAAQTHSFYVRPSVFFKFLTYFGRQIKGARSAQSYMTEVSVALYSKVLAIYMDLTI